MKRATVLLLSLLGSLHAPSLIADSISRDPVSTLRIQFPDDVFTNDRETAGMIDITRAPFHADNTGTDDVTAIIQEAIEMAKGWNHRKTIFFPNGEYLLTDTLTIQDPDNELSSGVTFQGESERGVVFKLMDGAPGFQDPNKPKPVFQTINAERIWSNIGFFNNFFNLTIDVGRNNSGAVGIIYIAHNQASMKNVTVRSQDGLGVTGIDMSLFTIPGPALLKNVSIIGFDWGIRASSPGHYAMVAENLVIRGQNIGGLFNENMPFSIRRLFTDVKGPAVVNQGRDAFMVLIDSNLENGTPEVAAIENSGFIFCRNIKTSGYISALKDHGEIVHGLGARIGEYYHGKARNLFADANTTSLNLPIEDAPDLPWDPVDLWVNVIDFGATPDDEIDDSSAIQKAIDSMVESGATTLYFPTGKYVLDQTIRVHGNVKRIAGLMSFVALRVHADRELGMPTFRLEDTNHDTLFIDGLMTSFTFNWLRNGYYFDNARTQTTVLKHIFHAHGLFYKGHTPAKLLLEDVTSLRNFAKTNSLPGSKFDFGPNQVWARQFDPESDNCDEVGALVRNNGGSLWILGIKTEGSSAIIDTLNGGQTELLGGALLPIHWWQEKEPFRRDGDASQLPVAFRVRNAEASIVCAGFRGRMKTSFYEDIVEETNNGEHDVLTLDDVPTRIAATNDTSFALNFYRSATPVDRFEYPRPFHAVDGLLVMEAENWHNNIVLDPWEAPFDPFADDLNLSEHRWIKEANPNASNGYVVFASPDLGTARLSSNEVKGSHFVNPNARLDYQVYFEEAGVYELWVQGMGAHSESNGVHFSINGYADASLSDIELPLKQIGWTNTQRYRDESKSALIEIEHPGYYTLNLWMKEDGAVVDRIAIVDRLKDNSERRNAPESKRVVW